MGRVLLVALTLAQMIVPVAAQYNPGELIIEGTYDVQQKLTHLLRMTPGGRFHTAATVPGGVDWMMASPDNRKLWVGSGMFGAWPMAIREVAPDGTVTSLIPGRFTPALGLDGGGDLVAWDIGSWPALVRISPGLTVTTLFQTVGASSAATLDVESGDAIITTGLGLLRVSLGPSPAASTILAASPFYGNMDSDPATRGVIGGCSLGLFHLRLYPSPSLTTISGPWFPFGAVRAVRRDLATGFFMAYTNGGFIVVLDTGAGAIVGAISVPGNAHSMVVAHSRHLAGLNHPALGQRYTLRVSSPTEPGAFYAVALSFGLSPGQKLADGRRLLLDPDALFHFSLTNSGLFSGFQGYLNASGEALATVVIPNDQQLRGKRFFAACVTFSGNRIRVVSQPVGATIR